VFDGQNGRTPLTARIAAQLVALAVLMFSLSPTASARMCRVSPFRTFLDRAQWPFNRVLVVRVQTHHYVPFGKGRASYWLDAEVLEDINGMELRPRVRIVSDQLFAVQGLPEKLDAFPDGSVWGFVLRRMPAHLLAQNAEEWPDVTMVDYYYDPCESDALPLARIEDGRTGEIAAARDAWRARLARAAQRRAR
jgi:hypothetical protein